MSDEFIAARYFRHCPGRWMKTQQFALRTIRIVHNQDVVRAFYRETEVDRTRRLSGGQDARGDALVDPM
jgi:hypothetical protein